MRPSDKLHMRVKIQKEKLYQKRLEAKRLENIFTRNLLLRIVSKPVKRNSITLEMSRRIMQLILLVYRRPPKNITIKSLIHSCFKKKALINLLYYDLKKADISQERFIIFCFWYLNRYGKTINKAFHWILFEALSDVMKYEAAEKTFWKDVYYFASEIKRGQKLMKLTRLQDYEKGKDEAYEILKKL